MRDRGQPKLLWSYGGSVAPNNPLATPLIKLFKILPVSASVQDDLAGTVLRFRGAFHGSHLYTTTKTDGSLKHLFIMFAERDRKIKADVYHN